MNPLDLHTLAVHAGREDFVDLGVHAAPLDLSSTSPDPDPDAGTASLDAMVAVEAPQGSSVYARLHVPTVVRFEHALARLEGAEAAVAYWSGMAVITAALLAAGQDFRHVVAVLSLYGCTDLLLA